MWEFWDYFGKLASSWLSFWFQSVLVSYFDFFSPKIVSPLGFLKTVLTSEIKFNGYFSWALFSFHGRNFRKFSRTLISILAHVISKIYSRRRFGFQFKYFFHGDLSTFTDRKLKIFTRWIFFHGGKKHWVWGINTVILHRWKYIFARQKDWPLFLKGWLGGKGGILCRYFSRERWYSV